MTAVVDKVWKTTVVEEGAAEQLVGALSLPVPLARLLVARGFADPTAAARFLEPRLADIADPFELPGMTAAIDRISQAIQEQEPIVIYGDYDVDGITSTALMVLVLSRLGAVATPFLPNRMEDGYGLSEITLQRCIEQFHPKLIITVDCGTGSVEAVQKATEQGVDVVVTDHHEPSGTIAKAVAVVNPKLGQDPRVQMLAGVGVAFKLCFALLKRARQENWTGAQELDLRDYLDYVALGTVADIVPLLHENRILARHGLRLLNSTQSIGLRSLLEVAGVSGEVDSYHVGFVLGPRINAAGRIGDAQAALELLLTDLPSRARGLAMQLDAHNRARQEIEGRIVKEASGLIDAYFQPDQCYGLVVAKPEWHTGVIGIVASRLAGRYRRPVIVIGVDSDGVGRGSCRSIEGFDLLHHLEACSDLLLKYGGHAMAAGLEVKAEHIPELTQRFNQLAASSLSTFDLRPIQPVDSWVSLSDMNGEFLEAQDRLRPFGHLHAMPVWAVRRARLVSPPRVVGRNHLKLVVAADGVQRDAIAFNMGDREIPEAPLDIAFQFKKNVFNGVATSN